MRRPLAVSLLLLLSPAPTLSQTPDGVDERARARQLGVIVGVFEPGDQNAITDVAGVRVGHVTVTEGDSVRTGVTAILPHGGNPFRSRVPAAIHVVNGFGKLLGVTQVDELGELETPILLTCTLCVWRAADAMVEWLLAQPDMEGVRSINPVVGETNDGYLNDIRVRPIRPEHVVRALETAAPGPVAEGSVGAGTGTSALGWKGGIGTSSRVLPERYGGFTVGVLVQSNYGGLLTVAGAPVGRELGRTMYQARQGAAAEGPEHDVLALEVPADASDGAAGSIMIVVATDAPMDAHLLERLARRAVAGLARTGAALSNGSGDYVIAFSTAESVRRQPGREPLPVTVLPNDGASPLFQAVAEATEEAIYNSLFQATTVAGHNGTMQALPLDATLDVLRRYGVVPRREHEGS